MTPEAHGAVQSVEKAFSILETIAQEGGEVSLSDLSRAADLPLATVHRLARTLARGGYIRQLASRRYALGARLISLGEAASRILGSIGGPYLERLVETIGETANMAMLDRDGVVYVAQVPSRHSMRMFTEVGRRVEAHCTGVGKALLATLSDAEVRAALKRTSLARYTEHTITDLDVLMAELERTRAQGFAVDDEEKEIGVRCIAVSVPGESLTAISVSGPTGRVTADLVPSIAAVLQEQAALLSVELARER